MPANNDPTLLTLAGLSHQCAEESLRFFKKMPHDPRYCHEIFRRAIVEENQMAWRLIWAEYGHLVERWVRRHRLFSGTSGDAADFANRAFKRFWSAMTPEKFEKFANLKSLLGYLQMCVGGAIIDEFRKKRLDTVDELPAGADATPDNTIPDLIEEERRKAVWKLVKASLKSEKERIVVECFFVLGYKPRKIYAEFGHVFSRQKEVYQVKENVLKRLARNEALRDLFEDG